jgi:hypothetical protein
MAEIAAVAHPDSVRLGFSVHPKTLMQAPELAALAMLECSLEISARALLAEHPTLGQLCEVETEPTTLRRARRLLAVSRSLQRAVHRYRASVLVAAQADDEADDNDLPF